MDFRFTYRLNETQHTEKGETIRDNEIVTTLIIFLLLPQLVLLISKTSKNTHQAPLDCIPLNLI